MIHLHEISRKGKSIEKASKSVTSWGRESKQGSTANGQKALGGNRTVLKLDCGSDFKTLHTH